MDLRLFPVSGDARDVNEVMLIEIILRFYRMGGT